VVDWRRLAGLGLCMLLSALAGYFGQPLIAKNTDAINTVVTVFSILAGFLIALITLIAEPALHEAKDWKALQLYKSTLRRKLQRHQMLFYLYLITLGAALALFLVPESRVVLREWMERTFLALAVLVFLLSFALPSALSRLQMERYQAALDELKPSVLKDIEQRKL